MRKKRKPGICLCPQLLFLNLGAAESPCQLQGRKSHPPWKGGWFEDAVQQTSCFWVGPKAGHGGGDTLLPNFSMKNPLPSDSFQWAIEEVFIP